MSSRHDGDSGCGIERHDGNFRGNDVEAAMDLIKEFAYHYPHYQPASPRQFFTLPEVIRERGCATRLGRPYDELIVIPCEKRTLQALNVIMLQQWARSVSVACATAASASHSNVVWLRLWPDF